MPPPPEEEEEQPVKYDFNFIECFLFVLHKLGQYVPEFLSDAERLKDLRQRLQYFSRSSQAYMKKLKEDFTAAQAQADQADFKSEENRIKVGQLNRCSYILCLRVAFWDETYTVLIFRSLHTR